MTLKTPLTAFFTGLLTLPVLAATQVDERRPVEPDANLSFEAVAGHVEFIGGDGNEFVITGQLADNIRELSIQGDPSDWSIEVEPESRNGWHSGHRPDEATRLEVRLPAGVSLDVETVSGTITVTGMEPDSLDLESVSGTVTVTDSRPVTLEAESVSGNIDVSANGSESTELSSVSGNIRADGLSGSLAVETVSGNATVTGTALTEADFETVSGRFDLDLGMTEVSELDLSSHSGDITVTLPADLPIRLQAETFSGRIHNGFSPDQDSGRPRNGRSLSYTAGAGSAEVDAESFSGTIRLQTR